MNSRSPQAKKPVPIGSFMMKRVFRQDNMYCCGICRKPYRLRDEAGACLQVCWQSVLTRAPWSEVKRLGKMEYHCNYCQRAFEKPEMAKKCAEDCSSKMSIATTEQHDALTRRAKRVFVKQEKAQVPFPFKIPGKEYLMPPPRLGQKPKKIAPPVEKHSDANEEKHDVPDENSETKVAKQALTGHSANANHDSAADNKKSNHTKKH